MNYNVLLCLCVLFLSNGNAINHFCTSYNECVNTGNPEARCQRWFGSQACMTAIDLIQHWQVGDRLEAVDRLNPTLVCVANVKAVHPESGKVEITFDGWSDHWDYITDCDNVDLHPIGYCSYKGMRLTKPKGHQGNFSWPEYLNKIGARPVPHAAFKLEQTDGSPELYVEVTTAAPKPKIDWSKIKLHLVDQNKFSCLDQHPAPESLAEVCRSLKEAPESARPVPDASGWRVGMRLEAIDRLNPQWIAPANVLSVDQASGTVRINFDDWGSYWDYTARVDSQDLHPAGYAAYNGHAFDNNEKPFNWGPRPFSWQEYLNETGFELVPHRLFNNCQTGCSEPLVLQAD